MAIRKQVPQVAGNWLYKDISSWKRLFSTTVYLSPTDEPWLECTNEEKEDWEADHIQDGTAYMRNEQITQHINDNSTRTTVPSAKAVYNKIKDIKYTVDTVTPDEGNFVKGEEYTVQSAFQRTANILKGRQVEISRKEDTANKTTVINNQSTDIQFPSAKAVYDKIKGIKFEVGEIIPTTTNFIEGEEYEVQSAFQRTANLMAGQQGEIDDINSKIPNQASVQNPLADKAFVNDTIKENTANFRGNWTNWVSVPTDENLYPEDYAGNRTPTNNDYLVVQDASDWVGQEVIEGQWRFLFTGTWSEVGKTGWKPQYQIGKVFTPAQQAALDSNITSTLTQQITTNKNDITSLKTNKVSITNLGGKVYGTTEGGMQTVYDLDEVGAPIDDNDISNRKTWSSEKIDKNLRLGSVDLTIECTMDNSGEYPESELVFTGIDNLPDGLTIANMTFIIKSEGEQEVISEDEKVIIVQQKINMGSEEEPDISTVQYISLMGYYSSIYASYTITHNVTGRMCISTRTNLIRFSGDGGWEYYVANDSEAVSNKMTEYSDSPMSDFEEQTLYPSFKCMDEYVQGELINKIVIRDYTIQQ